MTKKNQRFSPGPMLRTAEELEDPNVTSESALRISSARVVWADYELLRHDFPQLRSRSLLTAQPELRRLRGKKRKAALQHIIDGWLLRNGAIISQSQADHSQVNTQIETSGEMVEVYRPPRYGRSLVVSLRNNNRSLAPQLAARWEEEADGLLDLKGVGTAPTIVPADSIYGNGLMPLREALADLVLQQAMEALFRHAGTGFRCVPVYAVLDPGFDVLSKFFPPRPAGIQVRRAHRRPVGGAELPFRGSDEQFVKFEIEMLLRRYGITSANASTVITVEDCDGQLEITYGQRPTDGYWHNRQQYQQFLDAIGVEGPAQFAGVNIQLTREIGRNPSSAQLIDFGHYEIHQRFNDPVVSLVRDRVMRWGGVIEPGNPHFVQPHPDLCPPSEHWGGRKHEEFCAILADEFRARELDGEQLRARLHALLATATTRWAAAG